MQEHLKQLVGKNLVCEEGREKWKPGKRLYYSLTDKGEQYLIKSVANKINPLLRVVEKITKNLLTNPNNLHKFREFLKKNPPLPRINRIEKQKEKYSEKQLLDYFAEVELIHSPLRESFKALFRLFMEVWGPRKRDGELLKVMIAFTKEGYPYMIPVSLLKKKNFAIGL